jgi:hypothetical protein
VLVTLLDDDLRLEMSVVLLRPDGTEGRLTTLMVALRYVRRFPACGFRIVQGGLTMHLAPNQ